LKRPSIYYERLVGVEKMDKKEIFKWMWNHKPRWERNSDEEREHNKFLKELEEYYKTT